MTDGYFKIDAYQTNDGMADSLVVEFQNEISFKTVYLWVMNTCCNMGDSSIDVRAGNHLDYLQNEIIGTIPSDGFFGSFIISCDTKARYIHLGSPSSFPNAIWLSVYDF